MKKFELKKVVPVVAGVGAASLMGVQNAAAEGLFTIPSLATDDIVALMTAVLAGLALMWAARKIIKTMNRS